MLVAAGAAGAQTSNTATQFRGAGEGGEGGFLRHIRDVCPLLGARGTSRSSLEQDLFLRCNSVLAPNTPTGQTATNEILDQYYGAQGIAAQSDAATRANRAEVALNGRLAAIGAQMRSGQFASRDPSRPVLLASTSGDIPLGLRPSSWDGYASVGGFDGDQDTTSNELGFDQTGAWAMAGVDRILSRSLVIGAAFTYVDSELEFNRIGSLASGGDLSSTGWSVSLHGVWGPTDRLSFGAQASLGEVDFDHTRRIDLIDRNGVPTMGGGQNNLQPVRRTANGSTSAETRYVRMDAAYNLTGDSPTNFTPFIDLSYYKAEVDGYRETGAEGLNLTYDGYDAESVQLSVGADLSRAVSQGWGVLVPFARARWVNEFADDGERVLARYTNAAGVAPSSAFFISTDGADRSYGDIGLGVKAILPNGLSLGADVQGLVGHRTVNQTMFSLSLRKEF